MKKLESLKKYAKNKLSNDELSVLVGGANDITYSGAGTYEVKDANGHVIDSYAYCSDCTTPNGWTVYCKDTSTTPVCDSIQHHLY